MKSHYKSYTEDESEIDTAEESKTDTEVDELGDIIHDIKSTFDYSLQLRKIEDMEEINQYEQ